jgi:hypothetical protein
MVSPSAELFSLWNSNSYWTINSFSGIITVFFFCWFCVHQSPTFQDDSFLPKITCFRYDQNKSIGFRIIQEYLNLRKHHIDSSNQIYCSKWYHIAIQLRHKSIFWWIIIIIHNAYFLKNEFHIADRIVQNLRKATKLPISRRPFNTNTVTKIKLRKCNFIDFEILIFKAN